MTVLAPEQGMSLSIPQSVADILLHTAENYTTLSRRVQLATQLINCPPHNQGRGQGYRFTVPAHLIGDFRQWVMESKKYAVTETEKDAIRRLSRAVFKYSGLD